MQALSSKYYPIIAVVLLALLHSPFILSDPDTEVSTRSRGAWTDEGLNTVQVRNFVDHGYLSMDECDNLIKTPYFGFILVPFFSLLGTHIWVGRIIVLGCILIVLFLLLKRSETRFFGTVLAIIALLQFHVFHYSHYSMAEMMGIAWILLGIYLLWRSAREKHWLWIVASTTCFSLAYFSKITFAYAIAIPFMVSYMLFIANRLEDQKGLFPLWKDWSVQALVTAFFGCSFYLKWYLPNQSVFEMVHANQGTGRFDISDVRTRFIFNLNEFVMVDGMTPFVVLLPVALLGLLSRNRFESQKQVLFFGLISWLILELHHTLMVNPPTRYLLPLYFSILAVVALAISELATVGLRKMVVLVGLILPLCYNLSFYAGSIQRRSFQIAEVQRYLDRFDLNNKTVIGVWGATLASETSARCIPVWNDFNPSPNPLDTHDPAIVFSETNEAESGEAFISNGIDLKAQADSTKHLKIWRYDVDLHWVNR